MFGGSFFGSVVFHFLQIIKLNKFVLTIVYHQNPYSGDIIILSIEKETCKPR